MLFNSLAFLVFMPIVFALYWILPHKWRWVFLLAASYYFYMSWDPRFIVLIVSDTLVSYLAGRMIEGAATKKAKKWILGVSLVLCFLVLFLFKYLGFATDSLVSVLKLFTIQVDPHLAKLTLPVGISFYTFQNAAYVIDVYRGKVKAERHFGIYATFIAFFPQLVAGPIERTENLLPQICSKKQFDEASASYGLRLMIWGFFKKLVVADVLAAYVNQIYNNLSAYSGGVIVLATLFFTFQIYCDFSGYSDIAIGTARLLGINLMRNFDSPYCSSSIREFWSRWHISLSTWFRDYVYIPLGGNRKGKLATNRNLLITFLVSGLWHGANWTFVLWGFVHGIAQVLERLLPKREAKWPLRIVKTILVFAFCAAAWALFRANNLRDAYYVFRHAFDGIVHLRTYISNSLGYMGLTHMQIGRIGFSLCLLMGFDIFAYIRHCDPIEQLGKCKLVPRMLITMAILTIILLLFATTPAEFVYFQF